MKTGELIKSCRIKLGWTQEELGNALVPTVQKSAIAKWENGRVENIKRHHLRQMAKLFNIDVRDFLRTVEVPDTNLSAEDTALVEKYHKLDDYDKGRLAAYLDMFLSADKYKKGSEVG